MPSALPSRQARALAAVAILISGLAGGLIGWAFADLQCEGDCGVWKGTGLLVGGLGAAIGVAIVAVLTLRAMDEWKDHAAREAMLAEAAAKKDSNDS